MKNLKPDFYFEHYTDISREWLLKEKVKTILSDVDSTLAGHNELAEFNFGEWVHMLKEMNISLILISNNTEERVRKFSEPYKIMGYGKCSKPNTSKIIKHVKDINKNETIFLGDQIFTDIWVGKRLGVKTALVYPIGNYQPWNIKMKRMIEKILFKRWNLRKT